jgi:hypothetical protein
MTIERMASLIKKRLNEDNDLVLAITGDEGDGKSTLGVHVCKAVDNKFDFIKNVCYYPSYNELQEKFKALEPLQAYLIDEAIKIANKKKWMEKLQQDIIEMYATERWQNKLSVMLIPRFTDFTENLRNHRIKIWIHIIKRGYAVIFIREKHNIFEPDPWRIRQNTKIINNKLKNLKTTEININDSLSMFAETVNFFDVLRFDDMNETDKITYTTLKANMREVENTENIKIKNIIEKRNIILYNVYKNCFIRNNEYELVKISETILGEWSGLRKNTISEIIKNTREKMEKLKYDRV